MLSEKNTEAKAVWKQIQNRMKPPLCKGHGEPCVIRQVKKGGVNQGMPLTRTPLIINRLASITQCTCTDSRSSGQGGAHGQLLV